METFSDNRTVKVLRRDFGDLMQTEKYSWGGVAQGIRGLCSCPKVVGSELDGRNILPSDA